MKFSHEIPSDEARNFAIAIGTAMQTLRLIVGERQVCPVCFCDAMIEALQQVRNADGIEHGKPLEDLGIADDIGETKGNA